MIELSPAIVFTLVTKFGSHITSMDTFQSLKSVDVTQLNHKSINTIIVLTTNTPRKNYRMCGESA